MDGYSKKQLRHAIAYLSHINDMDAESKKELDKAVKEAKARTNEKA